jgi:hypothetical protein
MIVFPLDLNAKRYSQLPLLKSVAFFGRKNVLSICKDVPEGGTEYLPHGYQEMYR